MRALQVRHVIALDPQRGLIQAQRRLDLVHGPAARRQVACPAGLVQRQRLGGVPRDGIEQRLLVAAPGYPEADPAAAASAEPLLDDRRIRRQHRDEHLPGHPDASPRRGTVTPPPPPPTASPASSGMPAATLSSPYTWPSNCPTRSPGETSSTLSTTQPRCPRTRPSRT